MFGERKFEAATLSWGLLGRNGIVVACHVDLAVQPAIAALAVLGRFGVHKP